jgi:hypothetical protein
MLNLLQEKKDLRYLKMSKKFCLKNLHDSVNKIDTSNFLPPMPKPTDQDPPVKDNVFITSGDAV